MGEAVARDMLARFGFGATLEDMRRVARLSPHAYIDEGIHGDSRLPDAVAASIAALPTAGPLLAVWQNLGPGSGVRAGLADDPDKRKAIQRQEREYVQGAIQARLLAMANSPNQAHEALLAFWLNHFSIFGVKNFDRLLAYDYARAIEAAMKEDSFEALLRASFYHPAMQFFLDNAQSTAPSSLAAQNAMERGRTLGINENLARELMELHTLGVDGGYTQADIQELARIITGAGAWSPRMVDANLARAGAVREGLFLFDPRRHDYGEKHLLGQVFPGGTGPGSGLAEIDRALHLLAMHPATARHISRKLALRFLSDAPSEPTLSAMTHAYMQSGGRISAVLTAMMATPEFANSLATRAKFREPLDQLLATARAACQDQPIGNAQFLALAALDGGEAPFMRSTPDGYGAREADWFSPAALAKRVRFAMGVAAERVPLAQGVPGGIDMDNMQGAQPQGAQGLQGTGAQGIAAQGVPLRPRDLDRPRFLQGTACRPDPDRVQATLGPLSPATLAALANLGPQERVAVLLASPEALRR
jgi:uncharacterized protein (DUF1800 family)